MQITINENEIKDAIQTYVAAQGIGVEGKSVEVHLVAGRGSNGHTANIEILPGSHTKIISEEAKAVDPLLEAADKATLDDAPKDKPKEAPVGPELTQDADEENLFGN